MVSPTPFPFPARPSLLDVVGDGFNLHSVVSQREVLLTLWNMDIIFVFICCFKILKMNLVKKIN